MSNSIDYKTGTRDDRATLYNPNIIQVNICGLRSSWPEFSHYVLHSRPLAVMVVETLIPHNIINDKFKISGYRWVACANSSRGTAILLANPISYQQIVPHLLDAVFLTLTIDDYSFALLGGYHSPNKDEGVLSKMAAILHDYQLNDSHVDLLVLGDFNSRHSTWDVKNNRRGNLLFRISNQFGLTVLNTPRIPTYYKRGSTASSTIDLALTTNPDIFTQVTVCNQVSLGSDHVPVEVQVDVPSIRVPPITRTVLNTKNFSASRLNEYIFSNYDTTEIDFLIGRLHADDWAPDYPSRVASAANAFTRTMTDGIKETIGLLEINTTVSPARPFWWSRKIERIRIQKESIEIRMRQDRSRALRRKHDLVSKKFKRMVQANRTNSWRSFCSSAEDKSRIFSLYKKSLGKKPIPCFTSDVSGRPCATPNNKAHGFNESMAAISRFPDDTVPPEEVQLVDAEDARLSVSESQLRWNTSSLHAFDSEALRSILNRSRSKNTAPGSDYVTNAMLSLLNDAVLHIVSNIFKCLYAAGIFPSDWKDALISPIPKKSNIMMASDMRPIALVSCVGKLYERAYISILTAEAEELGVVPKYQAAFRKGRNAQEHVAVVTQLLTSMSNREATIALYLDISKAYNSVWHSRLLTHMQDEGFSSHTTRFLRSWLSQRQYRTRLDGAVSQPTTHTRGVPQGTVLSPILFNIYFSGVLSSCTGLSLLYADDAAIFLKVGKNSIDRGLRTMQTNAERVRSWCASRSLLIHPAKCNLMVYTRSRRLARKADSGEYNIHLDSQEIRSVPSARYLGVFFDTRYNFKEHCSRVLAKVKQRTAFILRLGGFQWGCPPKYMLRLYQAIALPVVQYFAPAFLLASSRMYREALASMQRSFAKRILSLPRCAGGLTAEIYSKLLPMDLYLHRSTLQIMARLMYKSKEVNKRILWFTSSWAAAVPEAAEYGKKSLAQLYVSLLNEHDIPFFSELQRPSPPPAHRALPEMPALQKHRSPWHYARACEYAHARCDAIPANHNRIYTDGSVANGSGGAAIHAELLDTNIDWSTRVSGTALSSAAVELIALQKALDVAAESMNPSTIISDSQTALRILHRDHGARINALGRRVSFVWIPSHTDVPGNNIADELALMAAADPDYCGDLTHVQLSYPTIRSLIRKQIRTALTNRWQDSDQSPELHMFFPRPPSNLKHIVADSQSSRQIARLRCGYCNANTFLHRHGLKSHDYCEHCYLLLGETKLHDVSHAFCNCPEFAVYNAMFHTELRQILDLDPDSNVSLWQALLPQKYESKSIQLSNIICAHALRVSSFGCF